MHDASYSLARAQALPWFCPRGRSRRSHDLANGQAAPPCVLAFHRRRVGGGSFDGFGACAGIANAYRFASGNVDTDVVVA